MRPLSLLPSLLTLVMPLSAHGVEPPNPGPTAPEEAPRPGVPPTDPDAARPPEPTDPDTPAPTGPAGEMGPSPQGPPSAEGPATPPGPAGPAEDPSSESAGTPPATDSPSGGATSAGPSDTTSGGPGDSTPPESTRTVPGKYIEEDPIDPGPEPLPLGTDTLGGHVLIGAAGAWAVPFGSIESGQSQGALFATGYALSLDLGVGISRTTVLGLAGDYGAYSADDDCPGCSATSLGAGAFLRYHLVQGLSFDPWMSFGLGYRQTALDDGPTYAGFDWAKFKLGGDWYPIANLGLGPVVGLTLTSFLSRSEGEFAGGNVAARFTLGGRIVFDAPGK